jgi:hypothetical protein
MALLKLHEIASLKLGYVTTNMFDDVNQEKRYEFPLSAKLSYCL